MGRKRAPRPLAGPELWEYALRTLSARACSIGELREKLRRRAADAAQVEPVLRRLRELGYLDDARLAECYAASRLENEGLGKIRVLHDLRRRRVAPKVAERAVERAYQGADEQQLIEAFLQRKYRNRPLAELLAEPKGIASVWRRLRAAGFRAPDILAVLRRLARDPELLTPLETAEDEES